MLRVREVVGDEKLARIQRALKESAREPLKEATRAGGGGGAAS